MTDAVTVTKRFVGGRPQRAGRHAGCAMQWRCSGLVARCWRVVQTLVLTFILIGIGIARAGADVPARGADVAGSPLRWPLAETHRKLTGGFGESRTNRFHAGLDLSTGGHVGAEVLAPAAGMVERVRSSGVGYGRSIYLRTDDGRLLVFGHLDAYAPDLAAYVDSVQRATGDYEQDLWPPLGRFRFAAGSRVAWSGQSGAGPPHLHVEVRHGDMAINPLIAGLAVPDTIAPRLERLILEPLDEASWVERCAAPYSLPLGGRARHDTLLVEGHVRVTLVAHDATNDGRNLPVRTVGARWNGGWAECDMDSLSWAGEMQQHNWLVDHDRVLGSDGIILDAPPNFRPRFLTSSRPASEAIDLVRVGAGDPARGLELYARDAAGNVATTVVWLRGPRGAPDELKSERGPDTTAAPRAKPSSASAATKAPPVAADPQWRFASLPDQHVRVRVTHTPPGLAGVRIERGGSNTNAKGAWATWDGGGWTAVLDVNGTPDPDGFWIKGRGTDGKAWWHRGAFALWPTATPMVTKIEDWAWFDIDAPSAYESGVSMVRTAHVDGLPAGATGLRASVVIEPATMPLRKPVGITLVLPAGLSPAHTGIARRDNEADEWEWNDARWDSTVRTFTATSSRLGQFALVRDDAPPEVTPLPAPAHAPAGPYSTWALTARVKDAMSGVLGDSSAFEVDGTRVPTEFDAEEHVLRWRPRVAPVAGTHRYRVQVLDHAGNRTVRSGTFVIASR